MYDESNPNICVSLLFRNQADAIKFESTVLTLSTAPIYSWAIGPDARHIHNISDTEPNPKSYKALMLTHTRFDWRYSEMFYTYRDTDYLFDRSSLRVRFPQVSYTNYVSTHMDKTWKPDPNDRPRFSHCEKRIGNVSIEFQDEGVAQAFMSALSSGYELVFSRRVHYITTRAPSRFRQTKSNKGNAEVQIWQVCVKSIFL